MLAARPRRSAWLAFGHAFWEVNRDAVKVAELVKHWRTDAALGPDFALKSNQPNGGRLAGDGETVHPRPVCCAYQSSVVRA